MRVCARACVLLIECSQKNPEDGGERSEVLPKIGTLVVVLLECDLCLFRGSANVAIRGLKTEGGS